MLHAGWETESKGIRILKLSETQGKEQRENKNEKSWEPWKHRPLHSPCPSQAQAPVAPLAAAAPLPEPELPPVPALRRRPRLHRLSQRGGSAGSPGVPAAPSSPCGSSGSPAPPYVVPVPVPSPGF